VAPGYLPVVDHLTNHSHHCPGTTAADLAGLWVGAKDHYGYAVLFLSYSCGLCRWPGGSGARATQPLAQYACLTLANIVASALAGGHACFFLRSTHCCYL